MSMPDHHDFQEKLLRIFRESQKGRNHYIDVNSGDLHRSVGGYPGRNHRMPLCCDVMKKSMESGDRILEEPPKGRGASLTIRYKLPR